MKVLTYYQNINFKHQGELIFLWKKSWGARGFEPIVLTEIDAKKSNFYEEFVEKLKNLHQEISKTPIDEYDLSCWLRWLAYSTQPEEKFYVSDYDVINHNFYPQEPDDVLHLMDDCCPCLASGKPSQFLNLCKKAINIMEQNKEKFIEIYQKLNFKTFHDQNFFMIYFHDRKTDKDIKLTRDRNLLSTAQNELCWEKPLVHYSHRGCHEVCKRYNVQFIDRLRPEIVKKGLRLSKSA